MSQEISIYRFSIKYGIFIAAIPILFNTILFAFDLLMQYHGDDTGGPLRVLTYFIIMPTIICIAIYQYKKVNGKMISLKEALTIGLEIALVMAFFLVAYDLLLYNVLAPTFFEEYFQVHGDELLQEFIDCCERPHELYEHHKNLRLEHWKNSWGTFVASAFIGVLTALIAGLVMRKRN